MVRITSSAGRIVRIVEIADAPESEKKPQPVHKFKPVRTGAETHIVLNSRLPDEPVWGVGKKVGWGIRNAFRWTHFMTADKAADSAQVLKFLQDHGLASSEEFYGFIDLETFNRCDIWSEIWWMTPQIAQKIIQGIEQHHRLHERALRTPLQIIRSAIYD